MELIVTASARESASLVADIICEQLQRKPSSVLGLPTGSTPLGLYDELIRRYKAKAIRFADCTTFNLDEYKDLDWASPQSYHFYMYDHFFSKIDIPAGQTYFPQVCPAGAGGHEAAYDRLIEDAGGIDIQILGIGHNGHIGFNEPADTFSTSTHVSELATSTRRANARFFPSLEDVPTHAVTMGIETIMRARRIILMVVGHDKADILARACHGPVTPAVPASILQLHSDCRVVCDREAAGCLDSGAIS